MKLTRWLKRFITDSQAGAIRVRPDLGKAGPPLNAKFVTACKVPQVVNNPRLQMPDRPGTLADECAATLP